MHVGDVINTLVGTYGKTASGVPQGGAYDVKRLWVIADTVEYVRNFLRQEVERNPALSAYRKRVIAVTGDDDLEEISRQEAIYGFAPISTEAPRK